VAFEPGTGSAGVVDPVVARAIRLVGFDVDGVMTDAGVYVGRVGGETVELKRFDIQDNVGLWLLRAADIDAVLVSGRVSPATEVRARELPISDVVQDDAARKLEAFDQLLAARGLSMAEAAFVGDDLPDLPVLQRVALGVAVANAVPEVQAAAAHVTKAEGGRGAVREVCEVLLKARGEWDRAVRQYLRERDRTPAELESGA
jgi:3-deoxy-D-manno-octulosonate 8-phosphate phosphatase (KDO 8-P phosphatase)